MALFPYCFDVCTAIGLSPFNAENTFPSFNAENTWQPHQKLTVESPPSAYPRHASRSPTDATVVVTLDHSIEYQDMMGFGGAFTDSTGLNLLKLPAAAQEWVMQYVLFFLFQVT